MKDILNKFNKLVWFCGDKEQDYRMLKSDGAGLVINDFFVPKSRMVLGEQTHSNDVHIVTAEDVGSGFIKDEIPGVDALVTDVHGLFLLARTADCTPVLLYDPVCKVTAAIHSGREGTRRNIVQATIDAMVFNFGCKPADIWCLVGPAICAQHYQVDEKTYEDFVVSTGIDQEYRHLDIRGVILSQLEKAGIRQNQIEDRSICTYEDENYFSYRRDGTKNRQLSMIGMI